MSLPRRHRIWLFAALVALTGLLGAGAAAFIWLTRTGERHVDVDRRVYPVRGIDVSSHNGLIDFEEVARDSVDFVYIKATEGATFRDPRFFPNFLNARRAGLRVGVYHFFRFDVPAADQCANLMRALQGHRPDLPVAIDVEEWTNPTGLPRRQIVDNLRALIEGLRLRGFEPMIYTNRQGYRRLVRPYFKDVPLWICSFVNPPLPASESWALWQHSHRGHVRGITGEVDINTLNSRYRAL